MKSENRDILLKWIVALSGIAMLLLSVWLYSTEKAYKVTVFLGVEYQEPEEYQIRMLTDGEESKVFCYRNSTRPGISRYEDENGFWLQLSVKPQEYRSWDAYEVHYQTDSKEEKPEVSLSGNEQSGKNGISFYDLSIRSRYNRMRYIYLFFGGFCFILTLYRLRRAKRSPSQEYILEVMDRERSADLENSMWKEAGRWFHQWEWTVIIRSLCFEWLVILIYYFYIYYMDNHIFFKGSSITASLLAMVFLLFLLKICKNLLNVRVWSRFISLYVEQCRPGAYAAASVEAYRSGRFLSMSLGNSYVYHINTAAALSSWGRIEESLKYQTLFWKETKERTKKKWYYAHYHNIRRNNYWRLGNGEAVLKERELIWSFMETHDKAGKVRVVRRGLDLANVMADITEKRWREARDGAVVLLEGAQTNWERLQLYDMMVIICRESGDEEGRQRYEKLLREIDREPGTARFSGLEPEGVDLREEEAYTTTSIRRVNRVESLLVLLGILLLIFVKFL